MSSLIKSRQLLFSHTQQKASSNYSYRLCHSIDSDENLINSQNILGKSKNRLIKVRQHVNPLASRYQKPVMLEEAWLENLFEFPYDRSMIVDIGCARGSWALKSAQMNPHINYLGLEIRRPIIDLCLERKKALQLNNVNFLAVNANVDLDFILRKIREKDSIDLDMITIQFPDPHFKMKHRKRRVVNDSLVATIANYIKPNKQVFIQSDVQELAYDMSRYFSNSSAFRSSINYDSSKLEANLSPFQVKTEREIATLNKNEPVYRMLFERK